MFEKAQVLRLWGLAAGIAGFLAAVVVQRSYVNSGEIPLYLGLPSIILAGYSLIGFMIGAAAALFRAAGAKGAERVASARQARDQEFERLNGAKAGLLQEQAIELHRRTLEAGIAALHQRALWAFVPGLALCSLSFVGPAVSIWLADKHAGVWQYMLGGSALAVVLLGAGTAMLRHDVKVREQIRGTQNELLYFSRLKTGLDCALTLGRDRYQLGLAAVTAHLLSEPPALAQLQAGESSGAKGEKSDKSGETQADGADGGGREMSLLLELLKKGAEAAKGDKGGAGP